MRIVTFYKEAVNRVTENIFVLQSYFVREMNVDRTDLNGMFDINEEALDDVV